jgi:hypothetical protein
MYGVTQASKLHPNTSRTTPENNIASILPAWSCHAPLLDELRFADL